MSWAEDWGSWESGANLVSDSAGQPWRRQSLSLGLFPNSKPEPSI